MDLRKINTLIADDFNKKIHPFIQSAFGQMQHNTGREIVILLARLLRDLLLCADGGPTWNCLHTILPAKRLPTKDWPKVLAGPCLLFQVSCASSWTQLSRLANVLNMWMIWKLQPVLLRTLSGTVGQSSIAFARHGWN